MEQIEPRRVRVVPGLEVLGDYQSSGFVTRHALVRRPDGQLVHVSRLVQLLLCELMERADSTERCDAAELASQLSLVYGQEVSADNVSHLVQTKLLPAGLVVIGPPTDGEDPPVAPRADALLALRLRRAVLPARFHRRCSAAFAHLFHAPLVLATVVGVLALDAWLVGPGRGELREALTALARAPHLVAVMTALTLASAAFHELGHAAAAHRSGARPGAMGVGVYLVWPVFYTDVTDTYRLDRRGRLRTDLGGIYFNLLFVLACWALHRLTAAAPFALYAVLGQLETARQLLPFVRLDGYYVISDLAGVPNAFSYVAPILTRLLRPADHPAGRRAEARLAELRPASRRLLTGWAVATVAVLALNLVVLLALAPRLAGGAWTAARAQLAALGEGLAAGAAGPVVLAVISFGLVVLPMAGIGYVVVRLAGRAGALARRHVARRPTFAVPVIVLVGAALAVQLTVVWPRSFRSTVAATEAALDPAPRPVAAPPRSQPVRVPGAEGAASARPAVEEPPPPAPTWPPVLPIPTVAPAPPPVEVGATP